MLKRKKTLKSPVELKKTRTSISVAETPGKSSVADQRQRAKEWAENEAKRSAQVDDLKSSKAKRSATPSGKTPGKRSKIVYEEDPEPEVPPPPRSARKSVASTSSSVTEEPSAVAPTRAARKTPAKAKVVKSEESEEEESVVSAKPARKTPAKTKISSAATSSRTPLTTSRKTATKKEPSGTTTSKTENSLPLIPIPVTGPSPFVTPTVTPAKRARTPATTGTNTTNTNTSAQADNSRNIRAALVCSLTPEGSYLIEETTRVRPHHDSLSPPSNFLTNMVTLYIFIGGIAYYDPQLGFLLFLAISILANLFVMSGLNEE